MALASTNQHSRCIQFIYSAWAGSAWTHVHPAFIHLCQQFHAWASRTASTIASNIQKAHCFLSYLSLFGICDSCAVEFPTHLIPYSQSHHHIRDRHLRIALKLSRVALTSDAKTHTTEITTPLNKTLSPRPCGIPQTKCHRAGFDRLPL